jgi:hypothetical protein
MKGPSQSFGATVIEGTHTGVTIVMPAQKRDLCLSLFVAGGELALMMIITRNGSFRYRIWSERMWMLLRF